MVHLFGFHFGPNNSYFVYTPQGWQSHGIPESELPPLIADAGSTYYPRTSYGVDGTYVNVNVAGGAWSRLNGKYPTLEQALRTNTAPIEMVELNPYIAGSFIIVYKNGGGYLVQLPVAYQARVVEFLSKGLLPMAQQAMVQQAQTNSFLLNLMANRF